MSETNDLLERRLKRLLWIYPRWYRGERGAEIVTTILQTTPPGRRWPSWRQARDLLLSGIACRHRFRGRRSERCLAMLAVLVFAMLGSWLGGWIGWQDTRELPDGEQMAALRQDIVGEARLADWQRLDPAFGDVFEMRSKDAAEYDGGLMSVLYGIEEYEPGEVSHFYDTRPAPSSIADRLDRTGWDITLTEQSGELYRFTAIRDGLTLMVETEALKDFDDSDAVTGTRLTVSRTQPAAVPYLVAAGVLTGLWLGWQLCAWASGHAFVRRPRRRTTVAALGWSAVGAASPSLMMSMYLTVPMLTGQTTGIVEVPSWTALVVPMFRQLCVAALVAIIVAVVVMALPSRGVSHADMRPA